LASPNVAEKSATFAVCGNPPSAILKEANALVFHRVLCLNFAAFAFVFAVVFASALFL